MEMVKPRCGCDHCAEMARKWNSWKKDKRQERPFCSCAHCSVMRKLYVEWKTYEDTRKLKESRRNKIFFKILISMIIIAAAMLLGMHLVGS